MPPPDALKKQWERAIEKSPELRERWGTELPLDENNRVPPTALYDLVDASANKELASRPPTAATPVPTSQKVMARGPFGEFAIDPSLSKFVGITDPGKDTAPARPLDPVNWTKRGADIGKGITAASLIGLPLSLLRKAASSAFEKFVPEDTKTRLKERAISGYPVSPDDSGFRKYLKETVAPITLGQITEEPQTPIGTLPGQEMFKAAQTWADIVEPIPAAVNWAVEPGLRRRMSELERQGHGKTASMQAAYQQAKASGEIPLLQSLPTEIAFDPVELVPWLGLYGGLTKAAARTAARTAAPVTARVTKEAAPITAKQAADAPITPAARAGDVPTAPATRAADEAVPAPGPAEVPTAVEDIFGTVPTRSRAIMDDLPDFEETSKIMINPNVWRTLANKPVIRNIQGLFNPSAVPKDEIDISFRTRDVLRDLVDTRTKTAMRQLKALGTLEDIFGKLNPEGLISKGPLQGLTVNTIRTWPRRYAGKLTPKMKEWVRIANDLEKTKLEYLKNNGIDIKELTFDEGGQYAGRKVWALVTSDSEVLNIGYIRKGFGGKLSQEKERIFETAEEAIAAGYRYLPDDEVLFLNIQGAYHRVIDQRTSNWLLDRVTWRTKGIPEGLKVDKLATEQKLARAKRAVMALNRAKRGESLPTGTVNSIERLFPQLQGRIREPTRIRVEDVLKAAKVVSEPERVFEVPNPGVIRNAKKTVDETIERLGLDPNDSALEQKLRQLALDPDNQSLLADLSKKRQYWGWLKIRWAIGEPTTLPHNVPKELRREAIGDLDELLDAIRGTRVMQPGKAPRFEGGLIADIHREVAEINKLVALERRKAARVKLGTKAEGIRPEGEVRLPPFAGKILTGPNAKEIAERITSELSPAFKEHWFSSNVTKSLAVMRFYMLGGDISPIMIQLLTLAGRPGAWGKSMYGFARTLIDRQYIQRYFDREENLEFLRKYPGVKYTSYEVTEATAKGGFLRKDISILPEGESALKTAALMVPRTYGKVAGTIIRPFARGYEGAMDVAGVELLKALDKYGTTPARRSEIAQHVNKIRGVTSSSRLGVSKSVRQSETIITLAPMYNRAIAAYLFDMVHFGDSLSGKLAREGMARMIGAISVLAVSFSLARGESPEEAAEHLLPIIYKNGKWKTNPNFFTWDIAGQKVGPGTKIRSVISLLSRSATNPKDLVKLPWLDLEYMKNPIIKFARGTSSPGVSLSWDLLTGKDYIGDPTTDGKLQFTETVAKRFMPIWVSSVAFEGGTPIERVTRGASEFSGFRANPEFRNITIKNSMVVNTFGKGEQKDYPGVVHTEWDQIKDDPYKKLIIEQDPANKELQEQLDLVTLSKPDTVWAEKLEKQSKITETRIGEQTQLLDNHMPRLSDPNSKSANDPQKFKEELKIIQAKYRQAKMQVESDLIKKHPDYAEERDKEPDREKEPKKWVVSRYYAIKDEAKDEYGNLDYDKEEQLWKEEKASWGDEELEEYIDDYIDRYSFPANPLITEYYDAKDLMEKAGWFDKDLPEAVSQLQSAYSNLDVAGLWSLYNRSGQSDKENLERSPDARVRNSIRILKAQFKIHRHQIRSSSPELDRIGVKWFKLKPVHRENAGLWNRLYGRTSQ